MRALLLPVALCVTLLLAACGDDTDTPVPAAKPHVVPAPTMDDDPPAEPEVGPDALVKEEPKPDGALKRFRTRMERLVHICTTGTDQEAAADARALLLPDPEGWFRDTFGNEHVQALVAEYRPWEQRIPQLPAEVRRNVKSGKVQLLAERFEDSDDEMATTFQAIALRKMTHRVPLYSMRLVEPGQEDGWHVWSFAWVGGKLRFVGRMMALTPIAADPDLAMRGSLRKKVEREIRTGK